MNRGVPPDATTMLLMPAPMLMSALAPSACGAPRSTKATGGATERMRAKACRSIPSIVSPAFFATCMNWSIMSRCAATMRTCCRPPTPSPSSGVVESTWKSRMASLSGMGMASCAWNSMAARSSLGSMMGNSMVRTTIFWLAMPTENRLPVKPAAFQKVLSSSASPSMSTTSPSNMRPSGSARAETAVSVCPWRPVRIWAPTIEACSMSMPTRIAFMAILAPQLALP